MQQQESGLRRRRLWTSATVVTVIAAAVAAAVGLQSSNANSAPATTAAPPPMPVSIAAVVQRDVASWDEFSGRLEAVERVDIRARVAGTLQAVHFREGALVKPGDLLFTIDPAPYAAEADRAQAQLVAAQARLSFTTSELERARRLWDERAIAQREFDERQNAQREADAAVAVRGHRLAVERQPPGEEFPRRIDLDAEKLDPGCAERRLMAEHVGGPLRAGPQASDGEHQGRRGL